jgi:stage II sporulation protein D
VRVGLEAYVAGVLAGEQAVGTLPAAVATKVLELQAVISRTYAVANRGRHAREGFDLCAETHCQVFRPDGRPGGRRPLVEAAVATTAGVVLTHGGKPIQALFHADCGGHTSAAADVWGGPGQPYLVARPDPWCSTRASSAWTLRLTTAELGQALAAGGLAGIQGDVRSVEVGRVDQGGRASTLVVRGTVPVAVRGEDFRRAVTRRLGPRAFRSLTITVERTADGFLFRGRGFGHGAGLCQAGALARLQAGESVQQVLSYYYAGTTMGSGLYF